MLLLLYSPGFFFHFLFFFRFDSEAEPTFCRSLVLLLLLFHLVLLPLPSSMFFGYIIHTDVSLCSDCCCFSCIEKCLDTVGLKRTKAPLALSTSKIDQNQLEYFSHATDTCVCVCVCARLATFDPKFCVSHSRSEE